MGFTWVFLLFPFFCLSPLSSQHSGPGKRGAMLPAHRALPSPQHGGRIWAPRHQPCPHGLGVGLRRRGRHGAGPQASRAPKHPPAGRSRPAVRPRRAEGPRRWRRWLPTASYRGPARPPGTPPGLRGAGPTGWGAAPAPPHAQAPRAGRAGPGRSGAGGGAEARRSGAGGGAGGGGRWAAGAGRCSGRCWPCARPAAGPVSPGEPPGCRGWGSGPRRGLFAPERVLPCGCCFVSPCQRPGRCMGTPVPPEPLSRSLGPQSPELPGGGRAVVALRVSSAEHLCRPRGKRVSPSRDAALPLPPCPSTLLCDEPPLAGDAATGRDRKLRQISGSGIYPVSREPAAYRCWGTSPGNTAVCGTGTRFAVLSVCRLSSSTCLVTCKKKCEEAKVGFGLKACRQQGCLTFGGRLRAAGGL